LSCPGIGGVEGRPDRTSGQARQKRLATINTNESAFSQLSMKEYGNVLLGLLDR
jgi:hypothetical protein